MAGTEPARVELDHHPLREIRDICVDAAGRSRGIDGINRHDLNASIGSPAVWGSGVRTDGHGFNTGFCLGHTERVENLMLDKVFPTLACDCGEDLTGGDVHHIVIGVRGTKPRDELGGANAAYDLVTRIVRVKPEQVTGTETEAAAVCQHVADREFARDIRIRKRKIRDELRHAIVPLQLSLVHQDREACGGKCFGIRGDLEKRVRVDRCGIAEPLDTIAFGEDDLTVLHNGDGQTRCIELLERMCDVCIEIRRQACLLSR